MPKWLYVGCLKIFVIFAPRRHFSRQINPMKVKIKPWRNDKTFHWPQQQWHLKNCLWFKTCDAYANEWHIWLCMESKQIKLEPRGFCQPTPYLVFTHCCLSNLSDTYLVSPGGPGGWWSLCSSREVRAGAGQGSEGGQSPRSGGYTLRPCWGASSSSPSVSDCKTRLWPPPSPGPAVQPASLFPDYQEWIFCVEKIMFFCRKRRSLFRPIFLLCIKDCTGTSKPPLNQLY